MSGIATAIIVESRPSMKKAQPITSGIRILRGCSRAKLLCVPTLDFMTLAGDHNRSRTHGGAAMVNETEIGPEILERWALGYLGRYASSAENLRRASRRELRSMRSLLDTENRGFWMMRPTPPPGWPLCIGAAVR